MICFVFLMRETTLAQSRNSTTLAGLQYKIIFCVQDRLKMGGGSFKIDFNIRVHICKLFTL